MCTCGKWQMERFPCSHALAVCRNRGDNPLSIVNNVYTTMTYRQQYNFGFVPLPHVDYWLDSNWTIEADYSKLSVHRGRRRANRIHNEMDIRHPDEPRRCTLCHQPELRRRKENKIKLEFFKRNGGYLLTQHISANKSHVIKLKIYSAKVIEKATIGFSQSRLLGKGGQGTVYKGFLTDGTIVAIKRSNVVDEDQVERFVNEVFILAQINHRNTVRLLGCCLEYEVPLLVYEYLSNGTLSQHLHDGEEVSKFSWKDRMRVARDVAGALFYLHSYASPAIFHRDVKPHNILLDQNYKAVVSTLDFQEKSDVYAFGVVLTELLTRRKVVSSINCSEGLVSRFQFLVKHNRVLEILDKHVLDEALMDDILLVTKLAKTCMKKNVKERPSMREVVIDLDKLKAVQLELPRKD
ncbi:unnamed protein product [Lactuca saligna]|uniref:Protein kinase domain-containing protein n=1 Tax=Lactuca saligna TaxID=75948 RepID=A0AA35ZI41_LACSI|nr:unnamed protein product [Lactuca saligna]